MRRGRSPAVLVESDVVRFHDLANLLSEFGATGGRVLDLEQPLRKAIKIVDRARTRHGSHSRRIQVPVSRDDQNRSGPRDRLTERAPGGRVSVRLERVHRAAVPDEDGRHRLFGAHFCLDSHAVTVASSAGRVCRPSRPRASSFCAEVD